MEEEPWWKKAAQGVMESVKDKLVKKEPIIEPNFGKPYPEVLNAVVESFRGEVLHISELGRFRSENAELCCYAVVFRERCELEGMEAINPLFAVFSGGKPQFALRLESKYVQKERMGSAIVSELNFLSSIYLLYKEFASTKPWLKYDSYGFEEFKLTKLKQKK
ncbi:MAG: hypothetical protein QXF56_05740 [Candidatus Micrarchaeia archaeon]